MEPKFNTNNLKRDRIRSRSNTIPVIVDNTVNLPDYNMVRFVYFSIDAADNPKSYKMKVSNHAIPFLLIEFQGIIHSPLKGTRFGTPDAIGKLFDVIEKTGDFFVDTNDIWIPTAMFSAKPIRGDVYRVSSELFGLALKFRNDKIESENFIAHTERNKDEIFLSGNESKSFNAWSQSLVQDAREIYPKNSEMRLSYAEKS
jgi:hypothetical protein